MNRFFRFTFIFAAALFTVAAFAEPVSTGRWNDIAIGGYDALAYYDDGAVASEPVAVGVKKHIVEWQGAKWRFATQAAAERFAAAPRRYAPRYNGHCANALSLGKGLVATGGGVWDFFGDELHLFYAEAGRRRWLNGDWRAYQSAADRHWQKELGE